MTHAVAAAPPAAAGGGKLLTLEAGRFFAATAVLLYHMTAIVQHFRGGVIVFGDMFRAGHVGVPYFFVLSGFIIYRVHRGDMARPSALGPFFARRAIRILPMFWLVSLAMLLGFALVPALQDARSLDPLGLVADLLLLPHAGAVLTISWTLRHEVIFYALFACAIAFGRRAFLLIAAWIALSFWLGIAYGVSAEQIGDWSVIAQVVNLGFGLGMIVAELSARRSVASPWIWIAAGGAVLFATCALEWLWGHGVDHRIVVLGAGGDLVYLFAAAVLIYGLVGLERAWRMPAAGLWKLLGGASYLIYLVHQPVGSVIVRLLRRFAGMPPELVFLIGVVASIATALLLHLLVERPLLRRLTRAIAPRSRPSGEATAA